MGIRQRAAVIGAGVIGANVAYRLSRGGHAVTVYESEWPGSGLTRRGGGMMRTHFTHPLNVALSHRSLALWAEFRERLGHALDWREVGYAVFADSAEGAAAIDASVALQHDLGVEVERLGPAELAGRFPAIRADGVLMAAFAPRGGYGNPALCADLLLRAAGESGAVTRIGETVEEITGDGGLRTSAGGPWERFDCIIVCAGLASARLAGQVGPALAFTPLRVQSFVTAALDVGDLPCLLDVGPDGLCVRTDHGGLLAGRMEPRTELEDHQRLDWRHQAPLVAEALRRRLRVPDDIGFNRGWAGAFDETPDGFPYLGRGPAGSAVVWATGMCGHGFMQAPAVAEAVLALVQGDPPPVDLTPADPLRVPGASRAAHGL